MNSNTANTLENFSHKKYIIRKSIFKIFGSAFDIFDPMGNVVFYSKMKAFKLKEDIRLFTGEDMGTEVLRIQARNIIDFSATYDVIDSSSNMKIGALKRKGIKSIFKDEWIIMDTEDREKGVVKEDIVIPL